MRLRDLLAMTPEDVRRRGMKLRLSGHKRSALGASVRYTVMVKGDTEPKTTTIEVDKSQDVQVRCVCKYFQETLLPSLLRMGALLSPEDTRTARGMARATKRLGLCKHLFFAGLLVHKGELDPDEKEGDEDKKDSQKSDLANRVSPALKDG